VTELRNAGRLVTQGDETAWKQLISAFVPLGARPAA
jgi:hypothetical protein